AVAVEIQLDEPDARPVRVDHRVVLSVLVDAERERAKTAGGFVVCGGRMIARSERPRRRAQHHDACGRRMPSGQSSRAGLAHRRMIRAAGGRRHGKPVITRSLSTDTSERGNEYTRTMPKRTAGSGSRGPADGSAVT